MNDLLQSIVMGIVQGASEFLPISSSGHLILIPRIFNWQDKGLAFDVALHLGTLIAVLTYFFNDWKQIIASSSLLKNIKTMRFSYPLRTDMFFILIISTIPGAISGILLENEAETVFRDPLLVAAALIIGGLVLFYSDKTGKKNASVLTLKKGFLIGIAQALAIVPGISRSGITISAALILGVNRTSSAKFSFLLSTPIILGAGIKEFPVLMKKGIDISMAMGIAFSALSGYIAIKYMIKYLSTGSYNIFVLYRVFIAILIFCMFYNSV